MKRTAIISIVLISFALMGCEDNSLLPLPTQKYSSSLSGNVILQNQTENSNALVYVDILNRGISTDSSGNYTFTFNEKDSIYNGEFKVYYYLIDYDRDSAKIMLVKGKVKLDTLDVDSEGKIKAKEMKQIYSVEGWTDKQEYRIGDYLTYTERYTNLSNRTLHFSGGGDSAPLPWVILYNENYPPIGLNFHDPYGTSFEMFLKVGEYYEDSVKYKVPPKINDTNLSLPPELYLVKSGIYFYDMYSGISKNLRNFIFDDWWKIHRGKSPKYDYDPNKFKLPIVKIIE